MYYISLAWAFAQEHRLFREVGSVDKPGVIAEYDVSGNPIGREVRDVIVQQAGEENPQLVGQKMITSTNQPYQQVQNVNQFGQEIPTVYQKPQQKPIITQKPAEKPLTQEQILQQQQQQMLQQQQQQQGILQQQQLIQGKTMEQTSDRNLLNNNQSNNINNK